MAGPSVKIFLSCVSDEFGDYRDALRRALTRPNVEVKIQEDFKDLGRGTLWMLAEYIEQCPAVVHFVGDMAGSKPPVSNVDDLLRARPELEVALASKDMSRNDLRSLTYTQWEAWLAISFDRDLLIVTPKRELLPRHPGYKPTDASRASQAEHLKRLRAIDRHPAAPFTSKDNLVAQIYSSAVIDALVKAKRLPPLQPRNLPLATIGSLFVGREKLLETIWNTLSKMTAAAPTFALHGLGGVGKTRAAIEYALTHQTKYSALLFVRSDESANLTAGLVSLTDVLRLPQKDDPKDVVRIDAVLEWLADNPLWLLILDNVDDAAAVKANSELIPRLKGGHVLLTGRASKFTTNILSTELIDVLGLEAGKEFLLKRTTGHRAKAADDPEKAEKIALELGRLPLGLEQAGAFISNLEIGFGAYLDIWKAERKKFLAWRDPTWSESEKTLATVWRASVARLGPESRRLLDRLAMMAPDPIPESLMEALASRPVRSLLHMFGWRRKSAPATDGRSNSRNALADLLNYSLATRTPADGSSRGIIVHPLVQEFARLEMTRRRRGAALKEALDSVREVFTGDPQDEEIWPRYDSLAPHALAVVRQAERIGITSPTTTIQSHLGLMFMAKGRSDEAGPILRSALSGDRKNLWRGRRPDLGASLANYACWLDENGRSDEALSLLNEALKLSVKLWGANHPRVAECHNIIGEINRRSGRNGLAMFHLHKAIQINSQSIALRPRLAVNLNNFGLVYQAQELYEDAEKCFRQALLIDEILSGPLSPVARDLHNLASLLLSIGRSGEAEPLARRALSIFQTSLGPDHPHTAEARNCVGRIESELASKRRA